MSTPEERAVRAAYMREWNAKNREKVCAQRRARYAADPERFLAPMRAARAADPEKRRRQKAAYYARHREQVGAASKVWRAANPERVRAFQNAWSERHRAEIAERRRAFREAFPERVREYSVRDRVKRREAQTCNHAGCLVVGPVVLAWQTNPHRCHLCGIPVFMGKGGNASIDHVIPISRGGLHCAENLRPACGSCNSRKGARLVAA